MTEGINLPTLRAKLMIADHLDHRSGVHKLVRGFGRIKIIHRTAGGVPAVEGVRGGSLGAVCHRGVPVGVVDAGERPILVHHAADGIGEGGVRHPIQDHGTHRHLTLIGFAPGLGADHLGQQLHIRIRIPGAVAAAATTQPQVQQGLWSGHTVCGNAAVLLKRFDRRFGGIAVNRQRRCNSPAP